MIPRSLFLLHFSRSTHLPPDGISLPGRSGRRVDASLRDTGRPRNTTIAPYDTLVTQPSIAVAVPGNAIAGVQEVDPAGARAVVYAERDLGAEPQRRRTVRR
jgi:hypothetical protein